MAIMMTVVILILGEAKMHRWIWTWISLAHRNGSGNREFKVQQSVENPLGVLWRAQSPSWDWRRNERRRFELPEKFPFML